MTHTFEHRPYGYYVDAAGRGHLGLLPATNKEPTMTTPALDLEAMAAAAQQRIAAFVTRSAAQHLRAMRKSWESEIAARVAQLPVTGPTSDVALTRRIRTTPVDAQRFGEQQS